MTNKIFGFSPRLQGALDARVARLQQAPTRHEMELTFWQNISPLALAAVTELKDHPHICLQLLDGVLKSEGPTYAAPIADFLHISTDRMIETREAAGNSSESDPVLISFNDAADLLGQFVAVEDLLSAISISIVYIRDFFLDRPFPFSEELSDAFVVRFHRLDQELGPSNERWAFNFIDFSHISSPDDARKALNDFFLLTAQTQETLQCIVDSIFNPANAVLPSLDIPAVAFNGKEALLKKIVSESEGGKAIAYMLAYLDNFCGKEG